MTVPTPARPVPVRRHTYDVPELAEILGIPVRTAYNAAQRGVFKVIHLGPRRVVVSASEVERLLGGPVEDREGPHDAA